MKRLCIIFSLILLSFATAAVADEIKLGSVDLPRVVQESETGKKAMAVLKEMADKLQSEIKTRAKELEKKKADLEEKGKKLSAAKRSAKEKELQQMFQEYQKYGKTAEEEFSKKEAEVSKPLREDLLKLVADYGKSNGYTAISHKDALIYVGDKYQIKDLTDEFIKLFDASRNK